MNFFLRDKCTLDSKISLELKDNVITDDQKLAKTFNDLFENPVYDFG